MSSSSRLGLAGALLLLPKEVEAGSMAASGTYEREASGDCSGYTKMIGEMARGVTQGNGYNDKWDDGYQKKATMKTAPGQWVQVLKTDSDLLASVVKDDSWPVYSATWSVRNPGHPRCEKEVAAFRAASDAFLQRNGINPDFGSRVEEKANVENEIDPPKMTEAEERELEAYLLNTPFVRAYGVMDAMTAGLGSGDCAKARVEGKIQAIGEEEAPFWAAAEDPRLGRALLDGYQVKVSGVSDACYWSIQKAPSEYSEAAFQRDSSCTWGGRVLLDSAGIKTSSMRLAAQCFSSVEEKRERVPEPYARLGVR